MRDLALLSLSLMMVYRTLPPLAPVSSTQFRIRCRRVSGGLPGAFNELDISFWGSVLLSTILFSIFCYTLELERLGRALVERKDHS
jgi:hypothetical protein